jgi:hypothetical protein
VGPSLRMCPTVPQNLPTWLEYSCHFLAGRILHIKRYERICLNTGFLCFFFLLPQTVFFWWCILDAHVLAGHSHSRPNCTKIQMQSYRGIAHRPGCGQIEATLKDEAQSSLQYPRLFISFSVKHKNMLHHDTSMSLHLP